MKIVLIAGLRNEFDFSLAGVFAREGYRVFAFYGGDSGVMGNEQVDGITLLPMGLNDAAVELKKIADCVDIYVDVTDERSAADNFNVRLGLNDDVMRYIYDANVIKPMAMLEAFFPMLEAGEVKRICYLTSSQASINETRDTAGYGYKMAKAGLHNFLQITRNVLSSKGYTIRVFDPCLAAAGCEISRAQIAAEAAFNYFVRDRGAGRHDTLRDDECNLVFRDAFGRGHSW